MEKRDSCLSSSSKQSLRERVAREIEAEANEYIKTHNLNGRRKGNKSVCASSKNATILGGINSINNSCLHSSNPSVFDRLYQQAASKHAIMQLVENQTSKQRCLIDSWYDGGKGENKLTTSQMSQGPKQSFFGQSQLENTLFSQSESIILNRDPCGSHIVSYNGNPGDRLYILQMSRGKQRSASKQGMSKSQYLSSCTSAKKSCKSFFSPSDDFSSCYEDHLLSMAGEYSKRREKREKMYREEELKECSFRPNLDQKRLKKYLSQKKSQSKEGVHQDLYKEQLTLREKQKQRESMALREIKSLSSRGVKAKDIEVDSLNKRLIEQALSKSKLVREQVASEVHEYELKVDKQTGQQLFRPKISAKSARVKHREDFGKQGAGAVGVAGEKKLTIGDYLYLDGKRMREVKEKERTQAEKKYDEMYGQKKMSSTSSRLATQKQEEQLESLFRMLDSDNDGRISSSQVDLSQLSTKVLDLLTPFLLQMEQKQAQFAIEEFVKEAKLFFKNLSFFEKEELYGASKKVKDLSKKQFEFKPQLSERSLKIAQRKSKSRGRLQSDSIHEFLLREQKLVNEKKEKENSQPEEAPLCFDLKASMGKKWASKRDNLCKQAKKRYEYGVSRKPHSKPLVPSIHQDK